MRYGDTDEECQIVHVDSVTSRAPGGILQLREYETTWSMGANSGCFYVSDLMPPGASCGALDVYEARLITPL